MTATGLASVDECIRYIESTGWKLINRSRGFYAFRNSNAHVAQQNMVFSLKELREAQKFGW